VNNLKESVNLRQSFNNILQRYLQKNLLKIRLNHKRYKHLSQIDVKTFQQCSIFHPQSRLS